jgi:predicted dienelactone hydrolase
MNIFVVTFLIPTTLLGCTPKEETSTNVVPDPWFEGEFIPGHRTIEYEDPQRNKVLTVEVWYPSDSSSQRGEPTENFEQSEENKNALLELIESAPSECPTTTTNAVRNAEPHFSHELLPLLLFSHCMNCGRYSSFSLAERLASHGIIVISVDHAGELPFLEDSSGEPLSEEQLETRVLDIRTLIDASVDHSLFASHPELQDLSIDTNSIGAFGHSFGSVTVGKAAQDDDRIVAIAGLAAPMENILFPSVTMENISIPIFFLLAEEDNSIGEIGNDILRANYEKAHPPVWLIEMADAGHWSISDLCGITEFFQPGCGQDERHSKEREGEVFTYPPVSWGIDIAQRYLTTFFLAHLKQNQKARNILEEFPYEEGVHIEKRLE